MGKVFDKMLARTGRQWDHFRPNSNAGLIVRQQGVPLSPEFERIWALPRREWMRVEDLPFLQETMTDWLKTPQGTQSLWPVQTMLLADVHDYGSALAPICVGGGKTLISYLAPTVVEACYPLLLIPAKLREKTKIEFEALARHWRSPLNLMVLSYEQLGRVNYAEVLEERQPDLIICDEVHRLRNLGAACTKRMRRYMEENPDTKFVAMSGTITKRSLMDFHHLMLWTLGPERMPLPFHASEARRWALAVDAKVPMGRRMAPGILTEFLRTAPKGTQPTIDEVRAGLSDRIMNTIQVVASLTDDVDASILIDFYDPDVPEIVEHTMNEIIETGESLNGDLILGPVELWRHLREAQCGFYYYWLEKPPREWMTARQRWFGFIRKIQEQGHDKIDSPLQVTNAVAQGRINSGGLYEMWKAVEPMFQPQREAYWISTKVLEEVLERHTKKPTLIWVEHVEVGEKLVELSGLRYFHRGGIDQTGTPIEKLDGSESVILSIDSNKEGRNLQKWSRNCIVSPMTDGATWEQVLARTHRKGQDEDCIEFEVLVGHRVLIDGMRQALADAKYLEGITRKPQKLLLADRTGINIQPKLERTG